MWPVLLEPPGSKQGNAILGMDSAALLGYLNSSKSD